MDEIRSSRWYNPTSSWSSYLPSNRRSNGYPWWLKSRWAKLWWYMGASWFG